MNIKDYKKWVDNYHTEYDFLKFANEHYYPKALNEMCFHGQQVIEKTLKSFLVLRNQTDAIRHHDLIRLAFDINEMENKEIFTQDELKGLGAISRFAVNTRYPQEYPCTEDDLYLTLVFCEKVTTRVEEMARQYISRDRSVDAKILNAQNGVKHRETPCSYKCKKDKGFDL